MKKIIAAIMALVLVTGITYAESGIFGAGIVLNNKGTTTLYELVLTGDSRHAPAGYSPVLNTFGWGNPTSPSPNLGTFVQGTDTLNFKGGELLTWKNGESDVSGANIYYQIDNGSFSPAYALTFNEDSLGGKAGDQRWYNEEFTADLLAGLSGGRHTITLYIDVATTDGTLYENNGGANFSATFTVVPAP